MLTRKERVIISAYTGINMCNFDYIQEYIQEKLGRKVHNSELSSRETWAEIKAAAKDDFLALCSDE